MSLYGIEYLKRKLNQKRTRVDLRYRYYEAKKYTRDFGIATPPKLRNAIGVLGWTGKAVDNLADRLTVYGLDPHKVMMNATEVFEANNPDVLFDSAMISALIGACSFVYVYKEGDQVKMQVIGAGDATGVIDETTGLLTEGYAVLSRDKYMKPSLEAYFEPGCVTYYQQGKEIDRVPNVVSDYCTLVPVIFKPDDRRPFGHSRITRTMMYLQSVAVRSIFRSEVSAEFYSFPQKYATGIDASSETNFDAWKMAMTAMLTFSNSEDGDKPTVGQFQQASQAPHLDQIEMTAGLFAGESGLTMEDLGFFKENPASSQSIKASHESLRLTARKAQRKFASCFTNIAYIAVCLRDSMSYTRATVRAGTKFLWEPIFEPDMSEMSGMGDAIYKINSVIPDYFNRENMRLLTGIDSHGDSKNKGE